MLIKYNTHWIYLKIVQIKNSHNKNSQQFLQSL